MEQILKYIELHIEDNISTELLAEAAGYSKFHFIRLFKDKMNCTPMEYVWRRKLVCASNRICEGEKIIDAAIQFGFQTPSSFAKAFRRAFGIQPSVVKSMRISIDQMKGGKIFVNNIKCYTTRERLLEILKETLERNKIAYENDLLDQLYQTSIYAYEGKQRYSGEEYVIHPLNVAIILAELETEINVVLAGLFCDVDQKGSVPFASLKETIPEEIFSIDLEIQDHERDMRDLSENAILIRLAERLHNMRTLEFYTDQDKRQQKIKDTVDIFLPIARKVGAQKLVDELNDLVMKQ